jgi:hypothetical protein
METPPSGKDVAFTGIRIGRCESARIAEEWEITDAVGLPGQIGSRSDMHPSSAAQAGLRVEELGDSPH